MKYITYKNPLYNWWRQAIRRIEKTKSPIYPGWETWRGFAEWAEANGYDENSKFKYTSHNPFTPEYLDTYHDRNRDCEYIAYDSKDPYQLIITSASYIDELVENLNRMGYKYDKKSVNSALSRNGVRRTGDRVFGLIFERIDLSNYNEDDEPFEERK